MRRSLSLLLCGLILAASGPSGAGPARRPSSTAQPAKALAIPIYPKGQVVTEINLSEQDLLPMLKEMLQSAPKLPIQAGGGKTLEVDFSELSLALQGLKRIRVLTCRIPGAPQPAHVARFYADSLRTQGWSQIAWVATKPEEVFALHSLGQKGGLFFLTSRVTRAKNGSRWTEVTAGRTEGMIDMVRLMRWIGRFMTEEQAAPKPPPPTPAEPAKPSDTTESPARPD